MGIYIISVDYVLYAKDSDNTKNNLYGERTSTICSNLDYLDNLFKPLYSESNIYEKKLSLLDETTIKNISEQARADAQLLENSKALLWSGFIYGMNLPSITSLTKNTPVHYFGDSMEIQKDLYEKEYFNAAKERRMNYLAPGILVTSSILTYVIVHNILIIIDNIFKVLPKSE